MRALAELASKKGVPVCHLTDSTTQSRETSSGTGLHPTNDQKKKKKEED